MYPLFCHPGVAQPRADKTCEDGEVGPSQHLPAIVSLCYWFRVALCSVTHLRTSVVMAV